MSIYAIRAQLQAVLDGIEGINSALAYPPDSVGALPCAFCGLNDQTIEYTAGMKIVDHALQVIVLVERTAGRLPNNLAAIEVLQARFEAAMEADVDLGNTVSIVLIDRIQQDTVQIGQTPYVGFVATLGITEKSGVTLT
jgi:hypothetical protein